jgi:hypothetical protein
MNHRLQLSPISQGSIQRDSQQGSIQQNITYLNFGLGLKPGALREEMRFYRSWLVYDSGMEVSRTHGPVNWNLVLGLLVTTGVSISGWYGIDVLIRHLIG